MVAILLAAALAQGPGPAGPPQRYRLEVKTLQDLDQTSTGGIKSTNGLTTIALISVAMTDSAGGQLARILGGLDDSQPVGARSWRT